MNNILTNGFAAFLLTLSISQADEKIPAAIYQGHPYHVWNRIHHAFFARPNVLNIDAVDPPLWKNTAGFLQDQNSIGKAAAALDDLLADEDMIMDPAKRAMLQHDLWAVFDWSADVMPGGTAADPATRKNLAALRVRLADAIKRLALNDREIAALPDNLAEAAKHYPADWDPDHPQTPFLPAELLDPKGPWVCMRGVMPGPVAPFHTGYYRERSPFFVFMRLPGGREATMNYLARLNEATIATAGATLPDFPPGTMVALLRRLTVIDTGDRIRITPLVQTLQMRVYRQSGAKVTDHKNSQAMVKFRLQRKDLFDGKRGGLVPVSAEERAGVSLINSSDIYHDYQRSNRTTLQSCIDCHSCGGATVHSIFTYKQDDWVPGGQFLSLNQLRLAPTTPEQVITRSIESKMKRYDWGLLQGLLESGSKR